MNKLKEVILPNLRSEYSDCMAKTAFEYKVNLADVSKIENVLVLSGRLFSGLNILKFETKEDLLAFINFLRSFDNQENENFKFKVDLTKSEEVFPHQVDFFKVFLEEIFISENSTIDQWDL